MRLASDTQVANLHKTAPWPSDIISRLCLVWVRTPHGARMREAKLCSRVCQVVFLGVLTFSSHLLIGPSYIK